MQCYPCPEGSFNDKEGSSLCKICPVGHFCYARSTTPEIIGKKMKNLLHPIQKTLQNKIETNIDKYFFSIGFCSISFFLIIFLMSEKIKTFIIRIDLYEDSHNHNDGEKIYLKKNSLGAAFTLIFYICFACIGSIMICCYFLENEHRELNLIPLALIDNIFKNFQADFEVIVDIKNYADKCLSNDTENALKISSFAKCSSNILASNYNLKGQKISTECILFEDDSCLVKLSCSRCTVDKSSLINFELKGNFSYSSGIFVNFTSNSFILKFDQVSSSKIFPKKDYVLIGPNPNIFTFLLTPSLLESLENFKSSFLTGYHSEESSAPVKGSEKSIQDLFLPGQLNIKIVLRKDTHGFLTIIAKKQSFLSLMSVLFGTFIGLMGLFGFFMRFIEKISKFKIPKNKEEKLKRILQIRIHFANIFKDLVLDASPADDFSVFNPLPSTENDRAFN